MKAVVQRVLSSKVTVDDNCVAQIKEGLMVLVGFGPKDSSSDAAYLAEKIVHLRIFEDSPGKMNLSIVDIKGSMLVVPQFTIMGSCKKGRRPDFSGAADPKISRQLFATFVEELKKRYTKVEQGCFQEHMQVELNNNGPVTLLLDTESNK